MDTRVRRVVTAQIGGRGVIASDAATPNIHPIGNGMIVVDIWKTTAMPAPIPNGPDLPDGGALSLGPPQRGTVFRLTDFPPDPDQGVDAVES